MKSKPTLDWFNEYHQELWSLYEQGVASDTTIQLDSGKELKVVLFVINFYLCFR